MSVSNLDNSALMPITEEEFGLLRNLIHRKFGINLSDQKKSLLVGRLQKLLRHSGHSCFRDYYETLLNDHTEQNLSQLVDRISTNHTYFNREKAHFDFFLETALPAVANRLRQTRELDLRVWCAGCSTGEEAYMLLMLMHEYFGEEYRRWNCGILATDISSRVLEQAENGVYHEEKITLLPESYKKEYLRSLGGPSQGGGVPPLQSYE
jgi:chemotaxis protein methyltransferase CheR